MTRNLSFDLLRILACLMVIMMHAQPISSNPNGMILAVSSYATAPCIGLFFMLSGALRLSRPISNFRRYFNNILRKILLPVLLWNLFYGIMEVILQGRPWTEWTTFRFILKMNNPTLWFIFPLLGLYIITPILQAWIESSSRQHQRFYLMLWGGTLCLPWFKQIFPIEEGVTSLFYYFSGYIGYYLLGSYLTKYASQLTRYSIVALLLAWGTPTMVKLLQLPIDFYQTFWYLSVFVVAQCIFWMQLAHSTTICKKLQQHQPIIERLSQLTFGVYLVHWLLILALRSLPFSIVTEIPFLPLYLATTICSILGSFLLSWLLYQFKWGRFLIGR